MTEYSRRGFVAWGSRGLVAVGAGAAALYLPRGAEAQGTVLNSGPINPGREFDITWPGIVRAQVYNPSVGLGSETIETIKTEELRIGLKYAPTSAGFAWLHPVGYSLERVRAEMSASKFQELELAEVIGRGALLQYPLEDEVEVSTPGNLTGGSTSETGTQVPNTVEGDCRVIREGVVTPTDRSSAIVETGAGLGWFEVYAPHKGLGEILHHTIIDRYQKVLYADLVTGRWRIENPECSLEDLGALMGTDLSYKDWKELKEKGALEVLPASTAPRG